ncbi:cytochrome P450 9e2-like [Neodiprion virginianus]|uniref:cytochrome P450 9e2-like n=1 Tax=Neodiprion virginianus TaxID=2961670 RepID=UPI001EE6C0DC|nr:cytochrome P450 9e2-like [Neodiprion virginianus]
MIEAWTTLVASALVALTIIYYYGFRGLDYFKNRGIPYLPPIPVLGNMAQVFFGRKSLTDTILHAYNYNRDAKYVGFFDFASPVVLLRDPELIRLIAIKNFENFPDHKMFAQEVPDSFFKESLFGLQGKRWKDTRTLLSPSFTSSKMKTIFKLVKECAVNLVRHLKTRGDDSNVFDMRNILARYTNDVILTSAFGISMDSLAEPENEFYVMGGKASNFDGIRSTKLFVLRMFPRLAKLFKVRLFDDKIVGFYNDVIKTSVTTRDARGIYRPDMLQLMMQARNKDESLKLTVKEMAAHAFLFYLGGFDTVSVLMTFAVHEITVNPDVQEKLQAEVDRVVEECDGDVTYEALHAMRYLDAVVNETLRLHTPATLIDRVCREKFELPPALPGLNPFVVEPGVSLWFPTSALQRDAEYFSDPEKFDPERFNDANKSSVDSMTYIPFGVGPRMCIGNRFALMETKLVLFELMANFNIVPCSKTESSIKVSASSFVFRPEGAVWLKIEPRNHQ